MTVTATAAAELRPATEVYKSAAILALIPDDVARYWARVTGQARIHGDAVKVYDDTRCDWIGCYDSPSVPARPPRHRAETRDPLDAPHGPRFCGTHATEHGRLLRAQLIEAARASRARHADLLASLRLIVDTSGS